MTCQITTLLREKVITASDSAVTVDKTKAWTGVQKTFKLSDNPPVNIMINGSPTINNFPVPLLIQEFEKICESDDIEEITDEFLEFIGKTVPKTNIKNYITSKLDEFELIYGTIDKNNYEIFLDLTNEFNEKIPPYLNNNYDSRFEKMIHPNIPKSLQKSLKKSLKKTFCRYLITESTGVVISGISKNDHFPSYISFNIILNNNGKIEIMNKNKMINCKMKTFEVYGQNDVINSYLTGIDEDFENEIFYFIKKIINPSQKQLNILKTELDLLKSYNKNKLLKNLDSLPDKDLFEIMETLIRSTSIKRKLLSPIDSVSNDVHIEKITKSRGIENKEKIYKVVKTIKS